MKLSKFFVEFKGIEIDNVKEFELESNIEKEYIRLINEFFNDHLYSQILHTFTPESLQRIKQSIRSLRSILL